MNEEIFDFDPHEGPHPFESQEEFCQRIEIRNIYWNILEAVIICWIKGTWFMMPECTKIIHRLTNLESWELISDRWTPTTEGLAYYFSDRERI